MFDKLFDMMNRVEPEAPAESKVSAKPTAQSNKSGKMENALDGRSVNIGYDYLKRKDGMDDLGKSERIQQKMELLKKLQKELGQCE